MKRCSSVLSQNKNYLKIGKKNQKTTMKLHLLQVIIDTSYSSRFPFYKIMICWFVLNKETLYFVILFLIVVAFWSEFIKGLCLTDYLIIMPQN